MKWPQSFSSSLQPQLQFFPITIATTGMQALYFVFCPKHIKRSRVETTTRRQINILKIIIIKNLHWWEHFESTSDFRILSPFNYDKIHIHLSLLNQDSLVSFTETFGKEIQDLPLLSSCLRKWEKKKISPVKIKENSPSCIKHSLVCTQRELGA